MNEVRLLKYLAAKFNEEIEAYNDHLSDGKAVSYEDYKATSGTIRGLRIAIGHLSETLNRFERGEDSDDLS